MAYSASRKDESRPGESGLTCGANYWPVVTLRYQSARSRPSPGTFKIVVVFLEMLLHAVSFNVIPSMYFLLGVSAGHQGGVSTPGGGCQPDGGWVPARHPVRVSKSDPAPAAGIALALIQRRKASHLSGRAMGVLMPVQKALPPNSSPDAAAVCVLRQSQEDELGGANNVRA
jgi:hypothetical protein